MASDYHKFCEAVMEAAENYDKEYAAVLNEILSEKSTENRILNPQDFLQAIIWTKSEIFTFSMEIAHDAWDDYNCGHTYDDEVDAVLRSIANKELKTQEENAEHGWTINQEDIEYFIKEEIGSLSESRPELFE